MANITGVDEMRAVMAALRQELASALPVIVMQGAQIVEQEIAQRAPVATGALQSSIDAVAGRRAASASATVQAEDSAQGGIEHYAIFKEYGTSKASAEPFFRPGVEAARPKVEALVTQQILNLVNEYER